GLIDLEHLGTDINDGHLRSEKCKQRSMSPAACGEAKHSQTFQYRWNPAAFINNRTRVGKIGVGYRQRVGFALANAFVPYLAIMKVDIVRNPILVAQRLELRARLRT